MSETLESPLKEVVLHAQRFAKRLRSEHLDLSESDHSDPKAPTDAERWICGRDGEIEAFVADVVQECRAKLRSPEDAAAMIDRFVQWMHSGFASMFGRTMTACCASGTETRRVSEPVRPYIDSLRAGLGKPGVFSSVDARPTPPNV